MGGNYLDDLEPNENENAYTPEWAKNSSQESQRRNFQDQVELRLSEFEKTRSREVKQLERDEIFKIKDMRKRI